VQRLSTWVKMARAGPEELRFSFMIVTTGLAIRVKVIDSERTEIWDTVLRAPGSGSRHVWVLLSSSGVGFEKWMGRGSLVGAYHKATVHLCLVQCTSWQPHFHKFWLSHPGNWAEHATEWYNNSYVRGLCHAPQRCLLSGWSAGPMFCARVAYHQYY
jgi:hypothetical protein